MIRYYINSAIRNLTHNWKFSAISISGFAFGISVCIAIVLFIVKEYSYDKYHKNSGEIVRVINVNNNSSAIDYRVKDILVKNYPEIENGCIMLRSPRSIEVRIGDKGLYIDDNFMAVDNSFFEIFIVPFVSGNSNKPFSNIHSAVLTESMAKTLFGTENPIGKEIFIGNETPVTVTGIIENFPENSSIGAGILVNAENDAFKWSFHCANGNDKSTYRYMFSIYLHLTENLGSEKLISKINDNVDLLKPYGSEVKFLALEDMHLFDPSSDSYIEKGNYGLLQLLSVIGFIILVLAIINYVNLTAAQQNKRNKDTGLRKTVGAGRGIILGHFLCESLIVTFLASAMAFILVWLSAPLFSSVFNTTINPGILFVFPNILYVPSVILFIGLLSGIGPAIVFSGINPVKVINGSFSLIGNKSYARNILTIFQFATSIILIFCVSVVKQQIDYVKHKDLGFNDEQLLRLDLPNIKQNEVNKVMLMVDELKKSPYIKNLSLSAGVPGSVRLWMGPNIEGNKKNTSVPCMIVDSAFIKTMGLQIVHGRNLEPGDYGNVCMFNEAAYKHFEFEDLENKNFNNGKKGGYDIIGVVNDFHFNSLHKTIGPVCIMFTPNMRPGVINIRFNESASLAGMEYVKDTWENLLPKYPIKYEFYDEWFDTMYKKEERFAQAIGLFAILAIVISCIGILGLSIFSSERRIKEIGIRKVNGAKVSEILSMLNYDFIKWVLIAFIIACPVAYYTMSKWLQSFAYKTELSWWIFALAGVIALAIAIITVSWQSWRAATRNPVEALRYE